MARVDAVVVGSGPNGLAAALTLARSGLSVEIIEGAPTPGGGCRTEALTLPRFLHDVCSSVHPLLSLSPFAKEVGLESLGIEFLEPSVAFAHPLDSGRAGFVVRSVKETAEALGPDGAEYGKLFGPLARDFEQVVPGLLAPLRSLPPKPAALVSFFARGLPSVSTLAKRFKTEEARALLAGAAAHSLMRLDQSLTAAFAMFFTATAHATGWPFVKGGSSSVVDALVAEIGSLGGQLVTDRWVTSLSELPESRIVLFDTSTTDLASICGSALPRSYRRALRRYRYGPGVCKLDLALGGPVPWASEACAKAGTVHVGGTFEEVAQAEAEVAAGRHPERPFCLVAQPGVVDPLRAPEGRRTLWAYCHVPAGSEIDMGPRIEAQIERYAPGFKDVILARSVRTAAELEREDPNYVGGDVTGGLATPRQMLLRPTTSWNPYRTPAKGIYLCSSSTPPGGGVHGMCGFLAARSALADLETERTRTERAERAAHRREARSGSST